MQALILTGGRGERMEPLTDKIPKPLLPVAGKPFLSYLIKFLKNQGVEEFILATGYKGEIIEDCFKDGQKLGVKIVYSKEETPLDTGGGIKKAEELIRDDNILIFNGDTFLNFNPKEMMEFHQRAGKPITMAVVEIGDVGRSGQLLINNNVVAKFEEKGERAGKGFINAGVYIFQKNILKDFPKDKKISLEKEIFPQFAGEITAFKVKGYFIDIGTKEDYYRFSEEIKSLSILTS